MQKKIYKELVRRKEANQKMAAVLLDPDECREPSALRNKLQKINKSHIDYLLLGGSNIALSDLSEIVEVIKDDTDLPLILFPGNNLQIHYMADAILFLSLISGRNPEYLIGQHVPVARNLKKSNIEVIPTGYILIDGGKPTSVSYLSFSSPIPNDKPDLVTSTAVAGELLGLKTIYLEAGSGATLPVNESIIREVSNTVDVPVIVGGGIDSPDKAVRALHAGADLIVIGNHFEKNPDFLEDLSELLKTYNNSLNIH